MLGLTEDISKLVLKGFLFSIHNISNLLEKCSNSITGTLIALIELLLSFFVLLERVLDALAILQNPLYLVFPLLLDCLKGLSYSNHVHCGCYPSNDSYVRLAGCTRYKSAHSPSRKTLNNLYATFVLLVVFEAELVVGVVADECQIFGQQRDGLDESRGVAFGTLDSVVQMYPITAGLTQRVPAEYEQPRNVELLIELFLAVRAQHLTTNNKQNNIGAYHKARSSMPYSCFMEWATLARSSENC